MTRHAAFPDMDAPAAEEWIGRTEEREGALTSVLAGMLGAALGHPSSPEPDLSPGAPMPALWHWSAFPEFVPLDGLGPDGHPALGQFLPPLRFSRRMWAGSRLRFRGRLRIDERLHRRSEILKVAEKEGATGPMVFVTVGHETRGADGAVSEEQDIVYLDIPPEFRPPKAVPMPAAPSFDERVRMNEARLFRYSAATYNAHRIHYDLPYAREVEKYPNLVVHGPMQATLLLGAAIRHVRKDPHSFRFRGVYPAFLGDDLRLLGSRVDGAPAIDLAAGAARAGHRTIEARMEWAP